MTVAELFRELVELHGDMEVRLEGRIKDKSITGVEVRCRGNVPYVVLIRG